MLTVMITAQTVMAAILVAFLIRDTPQPSLPTPAVCGYNWQSRLPDELQ